MLTAATLLWVIAISFITGVSVMYIFMVWKIWKNDDSNDDSNIGNPVDALNHFVLHGRDFQHVYYLSLEEVARVEQELQIPMGGRRPLWYMDKDKYSQILKTRPPFKL